MRVAVVDIGTNSTRLFVAEVGATGEIEQIDRRTNVTRLGQGVDATGRLSGEAVARVHAVLEEYREAWTAAGAESVVGVLTSAVRDAENGPEFAAELGARFGIDARTLPGEEEARLSFLGATSSRDPGEPGPLVVIDIGGGSTELIVGGGGEVEFFASTQAGVVRHGERHIRSDPPGHDEMVALAEDARAVLAAAVPEAVRARPVAAVAVAGTATSLAAVDRELEPYDPVRVHGHRMSLGRVEELMARLASLGLEHRREVRGLHPDRAPTIVAGCIILVEVLRLFRLEEVEVSEHDILRGAALDAVRRA